MSVYPALRCSSLLFGVHAASVGMFSPQVGHVNDIYDEFALTVVLRCSLQRQAIAEKLPTVTANFCFPKTFLSPQLIGNSKT
ncbi:MAG TPA: hypothetical protein DCS87_04965 [Rheinheimera sp.]|nr:hypothetical protein [Rheinheimera sp.]